MDQKDEELVDLIARCAIRDQRALKKLYQHVSPYLNAVAFRILPADDAANDVLQEAFIQIWENASSYRADVAKPLTWMTSILRYRALDRLDKDARFRQRVQLSDESFDTAADEQQPGPMHAAAAGQLGRQIEQCLSALNDNVQKAITLAYVEGFSREDIAAHLETNTNTVKSWLRRGSERLKKCLETKLETAN